MMYWIFFQQVKTILMSWDMFCPITHQFIKWGTITRAGFTLAPKCRKEIVLSPVAIFASLLMISSSGWARFFLMTPEQLLQAAVWFSDTGVERHSAKERELTSSVLRCVSAAPGSNQRTGLTMAHCLRSGHHCGNGSVTKQMMWGGTQLFSWMDGDNGCAPCKLFLIFSVPGV